VLQYIIAGLVLGGIYAIASSGLVITYEASGILNFAFGSMAYFIARLYYFLHIQHGWGIILAAGFSLFVASPLLGIFLYYALFQHLRLSSPLVKVVATLGLSVAIPATAVWAFGNIAILKAPGLAPEPVHVYSFLGTPVTMDQIIVYICVILTVLLGFVVLRFTEVGLKVRSMVDSPAMTALSGTNPARVSVGVWAVSTIIIGLAGILAAPIIGLDAGYFTLLMAAAFAAVVAARLRSLPIAVLTALAMGIVTSLIQYGLPISSPWTAKVIAAVPFAFIGVFLIYNLVLRRDLSDTQRLGSALDGAITPNGQGTMSSTEAALLDAQMGFWARYGGPLIFGAIAAILPLVLGGSWKTLVVEAFAYGIIFLSFTLVTGEGGMIWLCMITFAGIGGLWTAQLSTTYHLPVLLAIVLGGLIALPIGLLLGFLTIRLGGLYVALITLTFALLGEQLYFTMNRFSPGGLPLSVNRPSWASSDTAFAYVTLGAFILLALFVVNLRRSTTGMAMDAVRTSESGARTIGISVVSMKVIIAGLASFVAAVGGGFLVTAQTTATPQQFAALLGVVWLAVLVSVGIRSSVAALAAGLGFTVLPQIVSSFLPTSWAQLPTIMFGLGAIGVAKFPDGTIEQNGESFRRLLLRIARRREGKSVEVPEAAAVGGAQ
jgi:branched-chain amino acid transport system permease protein